MTATITDAINNTIKACDLGCAPGATYLLIHDASREQLVTVAHSNAPYSSTGYHRISLRLPSLYAEVAKTGNSIVIHDGNITLPIRDKSVTTAQGSVALMPIFRESLLAGLLVFASEKSAQESNLDDNECHFLQQICHLFSSLLSELHHTNTTISKQGTTHSHQLHTKSTTPSVLLDSDINIVYANPAMAKFLRVNPDTLNGDSLLNYFLQPVDASRSKHKLRQVLKTEVIFFDSTLKQANHRPIAVSIHASLISYKDQPMIKAYFHDTTVKNQAVEEIKRINRQVKLILESTTDAYLAVDDQWNLTYFNARAEELFQKPRDLVVNKNLWECLPDLRKSFHTPFNNAAIERNNDTIEGYYAAQAKWFEAHIYPHIDGMAIYLRDITETAHAEDSLRESEMCQRTILSSVLDGVITIDKEGTVNTFNPAAENIFNYDLCEIIGQDFSPLLAEPFRSNFIKAIHNNSLSSSVGNLAGKHLEIIAIRKDGKEFPAELAINEIFLDESVNLVVTIRDISERVAAADELRTHRDRLEELVAERTRDLAIARDEAQLANKTKSAFLANMSHELRTPLNAIVGYSEMLDEDALDRGDTDSSADLQKIHTAAHHLLALINDILDISKIEAGKLQLLANYFEIPEFINSIVETIEPMIAWNNNTLIVECPSNIGTIFADSTRLRQCLLNLLSNACKFTHNGTVTLTVIRHTINGEDWLAG